MSRSHSKLGNPSMYEAISDEFIADLNRAIRKHLAYSNLELDANISTLDTDPASAAIIWLGNNLVTKLNDKRSGKTADERRLAAIVKWLGVEERNRRTNQRIFTTSPEITIFSCGWNDTVGVSCWAWDILFRAKKKIARILGVVPDPVAPFLMEGGFTGGAGTSKRRAVDTIARKYTEQLDATPQAANLFNLILTDEFEGWWSHVPRFEPRLVKGNVLFTVPKNAEIDRVACKEPEINLWCQKAVGNHIRDRLQKMTTIDLDDQKINQHLASQAFKLGLSTIDLSSASDSLTTELCRALLPDDWYRLVMALRSPKTFIDGYSHVNEMISSMGNGFTFELQSLIFFALATASVDVVREIDPSASTHVGIFGDDIIVDQKVSRPLISILEWAGFSVNVNKTFTSGYFFESCGKHYYMGLDVSPFYIKKPFHDVSDLILACNQLRSWMIRTGVDTVENYVFGEAPDTFYAVWKKYSNLVPRSVRGGWDLTSRTQLVSLGMPRCRLVPKMRVVKKVAKTYQLGMYLARLHSSEHSKALDVLNLVEIKETLPFPEVEIGDWVIRRYDDRSRFFGIATSPLSQEMT